jgi:hypothetical protein
VLASTRAGGRPGALCRCDCGSELAVRLTKLASGHTSSCGCLRRDQAEINRNTPAAIEWRMSDENAAHCADMARSETNGQGKASSPAFLAHLAVIAADPARRAKAAEHCRDVNARSLGLAGEWLELADPDACRTHGMSFYDHPRSDSCVAGLVVRAGSDRPVVPSPGVTDVMRRRPDIYARRQAQNSKRQREHIQASRHAEDERWTDRPG